MKALIVTNTHNNRGETVELDFAERKHYYSDEQDRLYTINDFVDVEAIDHEQAKADKLIDYWTIMSQTILKYKKKEVKKMGYVEGYSSLNVKRCPFCGSNDITTFISSGNSECCECGKIYYVIESEGE